MTVNQNVRGSSPRRGAKQLSSKMFYYIGQHTSLLNKIQEGLYLDSDWTHQGDVWYKGYSTDCKLSDSIDRILSGYNPQGIWCVIQSEGTNYCVYHPNIRCFPEYSDGLVRSNLVGTNITNIKKIKPTFYNTHTDVNKTVNAVKEYLVSNVVNFHKYNDSEMNIWCTGGIDSVSIIALYEYSKIPYNIYIAKPKKTCLSIRDFEGSVTTYTSELTKYLQTKHWGYEILSIFDKPITLATGFYGDEFTCRGPHQMKYIANSLGKTILESVNDTQYMFKYLHKSFKKNKVDLFQSIDETEAKEKIFTDMIEDYQIWHLNSVLTFCPYYDERIINEVLSLRADLLLEQTLNADLQKQVINQTVPEVNMLVDMFKNTIDGRVNFFKNIDKVNLSYCKQIIEV